MTTNSIPAITLSEYHQDGITYHSAPLYGDNPGEFDALELLERLAARTMSSFGTSEWVGPPIRKNHEGCSALTLEYDARQSNRVATILMEMDRAFLMIPTQSENLNCYAFLLPTLNLATFNEAKRCSTLIAQYVETPGLTPKSYLPTFQFHMRNDLPIHFFEGRLVDTETMVEFGAGILTKMNLFER